MAFKKNPKAAKSADKPKTNYIKAKDMIDHSFDVEDGAMWLKSGKYEAPGVSIKADEENTLSDFMRKIRLRNVTVTVVENEKGYPEIVIEGMGDVSF